MVRFTVGTDGRVDSCSTVTSSGSSELDAETCRLIQRRFRYKPAEDPNGNKITETKVQGVTWTLKR